MQEYIKKYSKNSIVISILLILFAVLLMVKPSESINFIVTIFGVLIAIDGSFHIISYLKMSKELRMFNFELIQGILQILFGLFTVLKPDIISGLFPIVIGVWILMSSVVKFQLSFTLRDTEGSDWIMLMVLSIITFILGILMVINPLGSVITLTTIVGIVLFISEIINVIEYIFILVKIR